MLESSRFHPSGLTRRRFVKAAGSVGALLAAPAFLRAQNPNDKLNIAIIGAGGRGASNTKDVSSQNIVALCDVDDTRLRQAGEKYPNAKRYADFRKLFDNAGDFDAVVISTAEHTHAFATLPAL